MFKNVFLYNQSLSIDWKDKGGKYGSEQQRGRIQIVWKIPNIFRRLLNLHILFSPLLKSGLNSWPLHILHGCTQPQSRRALVNNSLWFILNEPCLGFGWKLRSNFALHFIQETLHQIKDLILYRYLGTHPPYYSQLENILWSYVFTCIRTVGHIFEPN